jgi:hypothetical protein
METMVMEQMTIMEMVTTTEQMTVTELTTTRNRLGMPESNKSDKGEIDVVNKTKK